MYRVRVAKKESKKETKKENAHHPEHIDADRGSPNSLVC